MNRPTIHLFDIDGTLLSTGGAGRRAMTRAFEQLHGRSNALDFRFDGMTDHSIVRRGLEGAGLIATPEARAMLLGAYVPLLAEEVAQAAAERYCLHPGMLEAVRAARSFGHAVGLGTGNIREGARVKLERLGAFEQFAFGGFGSDAEARGELIAVGAARGAEWLGRPLTECRVVVIGDTPADVVAAQFIGAESIAVGTGSYTVAQLLAVGATHAFADLTSDGALAVLLGGQ
jgi:phosphoglycolate phosphatase